MAERINGSVGRGASNRRDDVRKVQGLLNGVPPGWGGPSPALVADGICGRLTRGAIGMFQKHHFEQWFAPDERVDPGKYTIKRLNTIADTRLVPGAMTRVSIPGVPLIKQPSSLTCWAAMLAILMSIRDRKIYKIKQALEVVDAATGSTAYGRMFDENRGVRQGDFGKLAADAGFESIGGISPRVQTWIHLLRRREPLGVVGKFASIMPHAKVVSGLSGDLTPFGSFLHVVDPRGSRYSENLYSFMEDFELIGDNPYSPFTAQIIH